MSARRRLALSSLACALLATAPVGCGGSAAPRTAQERKPPAATPTVRVQHEHDAARAPLRSSTPALLDPHDVYAAGRASRPLPPAERGVPARVYVPNSQSATVDVIAQDTGK